MKKINLTPQYLAGMADADGSFTVAKRVRKTHAATYSARFSMSWKYTPTGLRIINKLKSFYGGNYCIFTHKGSKLIGYSLTDKSIDNFLQDVGPHVELKYKQVKQLLKLRASVIKKRQKSKRKSNKLVNFQERIYLKVKELNKGY